MFEEKGYEVLNYGSEEVRPVPEETLLEVVPDVEGVLFSVDLWNERVIEAAKNLRVLAKFGVGYDTIDLNVANRKKIYLTNTPGVLEDSVADFSIGLMLSLSRKIPYSDRLVKRGKWKGIVSNDMYGKCLGIIGLGRIGSEVARRAVGFKMKVIYYDIQDIDNEIVRDHNIERVELDKLLTTADFVSLHCNLTEATRHLLNRERLHKMKPGAFLVNCARGGVIDEEALFEILREKKIGGAALDVYEKEPPDAAQFADLDNLIVTTHSAFSTKETMNRMGATAAESIIDVLEGREPKHWVNRGFGKE